MAAKKKPNRDFVEEVFQRPKKVTKRVSALFDLKKYPSKIKDQVKFDLPASFNKVRPAIDIDTEAVRAIQLKKASKDNYEVSVLDKQFFDKSSNQQPFDYQSQALKVLLKRNNISKSCTIGLSASEVRTYNMTFPNMSEEELKTALRFKLSQLRPFDLDIENIKYTYTKWTDKGLGIGEADVNRVMVVCCSTEAIKTKTRLLNKAGLRPVSIEVNSLALLNLTKYNAPQSFQQGVSLWLNLGRQESSLVVEKDGFILFFKGVDFGTDKLVQAVSRSRPLNVDKKQAEKIVKEFGLSAWFESKEKGPFREKVSSGESDTASEVYRIISSHLESFIVNIQHSFKYFSYQVTQSQVTSFDRIFIAGSGAELKKIDSFLSANLEAPVERVNFFSIFALSSDLGDEKKALAEEFLDFSVTGSLAMSPILKGYKQLNLLGARHKKIVEIVAGSIVKNRFSKAAAAIALFLLPVTGLKVASFQKAKTKATGLKQELAAIEEKIDRRTSNQLKLSQQKSEIIEERNKLKGQVNYFSREKNFSKALVTITNLMPKELRVDKISLEENELIIAGSTPDIDKVVELVEDLKREKNFVQVDFVYSKKGKKTAAYNFEVNIKIKD
ncbi:MAG: pilus assembly protein PilM [Candidatus Omnitrophica bacterium]|nr:pilus assembly protein PilM [Candidatus Omnitrophota bacterium]MCF7888248.1 pilus assembly protein PilM [Candidatus Omnitrophota bacterium]